MQWHTSSQRSKTVSLSVISRCRWWTWCNSEKDSRFLCSKFTEPSSCIRHEQHIWVRATCLWYRVTPPPPPQVEKRFSTLICFGWRQPHIPRWQNECCHGNLLPGNSNSLATSQTVAMAQLSIYVRWYWCVTGLFVTPPLQSKACVWYKN